LRADALALLTTAGRREIIS